MTPSGRPQSRGRGGMPVRPGGWRRAGRCRTTRPSGCARWRSGSRLDHRRPDRKRMGWLGWSVLWLGLTAHDSIVSLIVEKSRPEPIRIPVKLSAGRWVAQLQADRFLSVQRASSSSEDELGVACEESLESVRGNAWLGRAAADVLETLDVDDVEEGEPISFDPDASVVSEANFWRRWPADVRATRWRLGDRTMVAVRVGGSPSERWVRLGDAAVWAG